MEIERIDRLVVWLVGTAEADEVGREHAVSSGDERRDHAPIEVAPRRLAVQAEKGALALAFVEGVRSQPAPFEVMRLECESGQIVEARVGSPHRLNCRMG